MIPQIGNYLHSLLDNRTGEVYSMVKTTTGYDGTVITPENEHEYVDGVIYRKLPNGGGYAKKVTPGGYGYIEWFVGDDLSNGVANLDAIIKLSRAGLKVKLNRGTYPLECATNTTVNSDNQPLFIEGEGEENTKMVLKTKHDIAGGVWKYGYFTGARNITLNNLTISTQSFENGILDEIASEYKFCAMYKPVGNIVTQKNCTINGSITFCFQHNAYGVTSTQQEVENGKISIKSRSCTYNYVSKLFHYRNCYVDHASFKDGYVYELLGYVIQASYDGYGREKNKLYEWNNMYLENTIIPEFTDWYHCPLVVIGDTIYFEGSTVKNLKNKNKTSYMNAGGPILGAETYALYASINNLNFNNNKIENVIGQKEDQNDSCAFKVKGAFNVYADNNRISLSKQALVDVDILESIDSPYSNIDKDKFVYAFFGSLRTSTRNDGDFVFTNNRIKVPYINYDSYVPFGMVDISENFIDVDYIAIARGKNSQALFFNHLKGDGAILLGKYADFNDNQIKVNSVEDPSKPINIFGEEFPQYSDNDKTYYSDYYSLSKNTFIGEDIIFRLGICRTPNLIYKENKTIGKCEIQTFNSLISVLPDAVPFSNVQSSVKSTNNNNSVALLKPIIFGETEMELFSNTYATLIILSTDIQDWFYNNTVSESRPTLITIFAEYINSKGVPENVQFNFAQTSTTNLKYRDNGTNSIVDFDPRSQVDFPVFNIPNHNGGEKQVSLSVKRYASRVCEFSLNGLENTSRLKIRGLVESKNVDSSTFYNEWLDKSVTDSEEIATINQAVLFLEENKADKDFATTTTKGLIKAAEIPEDSTAEDLPTLLLDFNNLLQKLREQNIEL